MQHLEYERYSLSSLTYHLFSELSFYKEGANIFSISKLKRLRHKELKRPVQDHEASGSRIHQALDLYTIKNIL